MLVQETYLPCHILILHGSQHPAVNCALAWMFIVVYWVVDPTRICIQVLKNFEVQYPLNLPPGE